MKKKLNRKILVPSLLLVLLLVGSFLANTSAFDFKPDANGGYRNPASIILSEIRSGTLTVERKLASRIAAFKSRSLASIGRPADPLKNLRFGVLEGKYALTMNGDKISEIAFIDNPETEGRPATITDRNAFLKKYGLLIDGSTPERVSVDIQGTKIVETYRLKTSKADTDMLVSVTLDDLDRLFNLKVRKVTALKIF